MSSPVTTFQTLGMTVQSLSTAAVSITEFPEQMQTLPAGTVLPAIITPSQKPGETPVITVTFPDGEAISFSAKLPHVPNVETPVSLKILPPEIKNALTFKIHFSAPLPNIKEAAQALQSTTENQSAIVEKPVTSITTEAFVLRSVPEQIAALLPELNDDIPLPKLPADSKINIELSPDQNALPALGRQETPVLPPGLQNTPLPQAPVDETIKVIELPKDVPADRQTAVQNNHSVAPTVTVSTQPVDPDIQKTLLSSDLPPVMPGKGQTVIPVLQTQEKPVFPDQSVPVKTSETSAPETILKNGTPVTEKNVPPIENETERPVAEKTEKNTDRQQVSVQQNDTKKSISHPFKNIDFNQERPVSSTSTQTVKGIVFQPQASDRPLIATKVGVLAVEEKIHLPHLTPVSVKIPPSAFNADQPTLAQAPLPEFKNTWTVLTHALETLQQTDQTAYETVKNILPQMGNKLPSLMLSFMHAATQGVSFSSFIGEANLSALRATEKGERLLKRLEKEFSTSSKKATDGQNSWKGWDIPFLSGSVVEPVSLYLQRPSDSDFQRGTTLKNQHNIRFVLDINLTKLGKIQMEGLARRPERRFDLILRHQNDLPSFFDDRVQGIFIQTLSALNYTGTIKVDQTNDFIVLTPHQDNEIKRGVLV